MPRRTAFAQALVDTVRREVGQEIHRVLGSLLSTGAPARRGRTTASDADPTTAEATPRPRRRRRTRRSA